jgi:hypothetical protein
LPQSKYKQRFIALIIFVCIIGIGKAYSQNFSISGKVENEKNQALAGVLIQVQQLTDSAYINGNTTNDSGIFSINNIPPGNILIRIKFLGYKPLYLQRELTTANQDLGVLIISENSQSINEVTIKGELNTGKQKGDTTEFNAGAFKTNPDASGEDLLNKIPGVTSEDGKLKAQGEDIKQVLVDGKPFFGDDPAAVLKNIPAEVIDKIQIFDRKSDQSQLTGFDDGNTSKTINIITKVQFKDGTFGKLQAGYGTSDKYKAGGNINVFKDKRRFTILLNSNNINEQNFMTEDLLGVVGSSSNRSGRPEGMRRNRSQGGGNDGGNFLVDTKNGISTTHAFGLNYIDKWKQVDVSASYFLNYSDNTSLSFLNRQFITDENQGLTYQENSDGNSKNTNHRFNAKFEWKAKEKHSLVFQPKVSFQTNDGSSLLTGSNILNEKVLSLVRNDYKSLLNGINVSAPLSYKYVFNKKGSTFSLLTNPSINNQLGNSELYYVTTTQYDSLIQNTIHQKTLFDKRNNSINSTLSFSQPLNKKSQVIVSYDNKWISSGSIKETDNIILNTEVPDTILSNTLNTSYISNSLGAGFKYQHKKTNFNAGISFQKAQLKNEMKVPKEFTLSKSFYSVLPNAMLQYKFSTNNNVRINYNSRNNIPNADQLQEVINNQNPLMLSTGNSNLKQDWQNNLNVRYTSLNPKKNTAFFILLGGSVNRNAIVNSTFITNEDTFITPNILLTRGAQISKPINMNGQYNLRTFINHSFPVSKIKSKLNLNLGLNLNKTPALINNMTNKSANTNVSFGASLVSNISKSLDFTLSSASSLGQVTNSLQTQNNNQYFNQNSRFKVQYNPWKGLILQTEGSHQYYQGLTANLNQSFFLWNAAIGYKFLKDKKADLRLSVFDALKQNNSLTRNTTEIYYEDVETAILQRYFMLTFTYNFRYYKNAGKTPPEPSDSINEK